MSNAKRRHRRRYRRQPRFVRLHMYGVDVVVGPTREPVHMGKLRDTVRAFLASLEDESIPIRW